jgi:hypothetical protein
MAPLSRSRSLRALAITALLLLTATHAHAGRRQRAAGMALTILGMALTVTGIGVTAAGELTHCADYPCDRADALLGSGLTALTLGQISIIAGSAVWGTAGRDEPREDDPFHKNLRARRRMFLSGLILTGIGVTTDVVTGILIGTGAGDFGYLGIGAAPLLAIGSVLVVVGVPLAIAGRPRKLQPQVTLAPTQGGARLGLSLRF